MNATALVSPLSPRAGWNYCRDGLHYKLQRFRQLTLDAERLKIILDKKHMPLVALPHWVIGSSFNGKSPFHKDLAYSLDTGGLPKFKHICAAPKFSDFLAIMGADQRAEYVDSRPELHRGHPIVSRG